MVLDHVTEEVAPINEQGGALLFSMLADAGVGCIRERDLEPQRVETRSRIQSSAPTAKLSPLPGAT